MPAMSDGECLHDEDVIELLGPPWLEWIIEQGRHWWDEDGRRCWTWEGLLEAEALANLGISGAERGPPG
jgi:hypothetical protein